MIDFSECSLARASKEWPQLLSIVEERVKPERLAQADSGAKEYWWQFIRPRPELRAAISSLDTVLALSRVGQHAAFAFVPAKMVFADSTIVFPLASFAPFCAIQSRPHEIWARVFGSSMKDDLRYTHSDCFETFPFPDGWRTNGTLDGKAYYDYRAALMAENNEGLTKTYNRFHDPNEVGLEIAHLRDLHADMDRAVLVAYGWNDIPTNCDFLLDYPIDEAEWARRRKPYRYRSPDDVRDEVLARLLELNARCATAGAPP